VYWKPTVNSRLLCPLRKPGKIPGNNYTYWRLPRPTDAKVVELADELAQGGNIIATSHWNVGESGGASFQHGLIKCTAHV
jgi:hypothetical protein